MRKKGNEYDIWIRNDTNASNNLQWFMFRMKNSAEFTGTIKINIVNFTKGNSLFIHVSTNHHFGQQKPMLTWMKVKADGIKRLAETVATT